MSSHASSPIGSSRFEDFKDEQVQQAAMHSLAPYREDSALVVLGGDGSLRGARAIYETFGMQVVGIPGTIDNNIAGTTSLGFHSASRSRINPSNPSRPPAPPWEAFSLSR